MISIHVAIWRATGYELQNPEAALSRIGFAGCASRARGRHWSVSVTHRFLRRGFFLGDFFGIFAPL